jgi:hypothetical protein
VEPGRPGFFHRAHRGPRPRSQSKARAFPLRDLRASSVISVIKIPRRGIGSYDRSHVGHRSTHGDGAQQFGVSRRNRGKRGSRHRRQGLVRLWRMAPDVASVAMTGDREQAKDEAGSVPRWFSRESALTRWTFSDPPPESGHFPESVRIAFIQRAPNSNF